MIHLLTKGSLFDMLSILLAGYLIYFLCENTIFLNLQIFNQERVIEDNFAIPVMAFILSYIIGMIIHMVSKSIAKPLVFNKSLAEKAYKAVQQGSYDRTKDANQGNWATSQEHFYEFYHSFFEKEGMGFIEILEAQYSFFRSLFVVGLIYSCFGWSMFSSEGISLVAGATFLIIFLMYKVRYNIHVAYFEAEYYRMKNHEEK